MKKKIRISFNSPLVLCFALACSAVALAGAITGESSTAKLFSTYSANSGHLPRKIKKKRRRAPKRGLVGPGRAFSGPIG